MVLLELKNLVKMFGGLRAVNNVSLRVEEGEIMGLIGPNGSGKTTIFNCINHFYPITEGDILFKGQSIRGLKTHQICHFGIGRTFQVVKPLGRLSVLDNITASAFCRVNTIREARAEAHRVLEFCNLSTEKDKLAKSLPIGGRKRLEIARSLATRPELLLLDETAAGLNPSELDEAIDLIRKIRENGTTVLIVEHIMKVIMTISDRIHAINFGTTIAEGTPEKVANNPAVIEAYLGKNMLTVKGIDVFYGDLQVLWDVSFEVKEKEILVLVGANGAGKSTTIRTISSLLSPRKGSIEFDGIRLDQVPAHRIIEHGIVHVPEGRKLFPLMTVEENLIMGSLHRDAKSRRRQTMEQVYTLFPRLLERKKQLSGTLSGGEQQMLAVGRGLMSLPKLMMFDEPSLGLAPILVQEIFSMVRRVNGEGVTVLLVEQNVRQTLGMCNRAYVLENGRVTLEGSGEELMANRHVREAYLGI